MAGLEAESKNICTTEEAFENFQAGAMYEEEEFITLSDIMSPPHTNPDQDASVILSDEVLMKEKNEYNINSYESNQVPGATSLRNDKIKTIGTSAPKRKGRKKKINVENSNIQPNQCQSEFNNTKPKRQRKKTTSSINKNNESIYSEDAIEELKDSAHIADEVSQVANNAKRKSQYSLPQKEDENVIEKPSKKGKRGRKPKYNIQKKLLNEDKNGQVCNSSMNTKDISTKISIIVTKSKKQKKGKTEQSVLNNQNLSPQVTMSQKCEDNSSYECNLLDSTAPKMSLQYDTNENTDDIIKTTEQKTLKNIKDTNMYKQNTSEEDMEEIPLSNLSRKNEKQVESRTILEPKNSMELEQDSSIEPVITKSVKKRGRPKKNLNNPLTKSVLDTNKKSDDNVDKVAKCDEGRNLNIEQKPNSHDTSEAISNTVEIPENKSCEPNDIEVDYHTKTYDNINTSTESYHSKRNLKKKHLSDFEYNIDNIYKNNQIENSLDMKHNEKDIEDSSRRPVRRRVLRNWNYDEGSDEDPYANMESSDDEPRRRKKGGRYYSDDEYFPGDKRQLTETESDNAMDEEELNLGDSRKLKKKKTKKSDLGINNKSPRKKSRKSDADSTCPTERTNTNTDSRDVDFDDCVDTTVNRGNDEHGSATKSKKNNKSLGKTNEFENFIAKIVQGTDIKISKKSVSDVKAPLQIPVLDANEVHKSVEKSSQTERIKTRSENVQTDTMYEIPMRDQVPLTADQSEKACEFLTSIVQTTAELGQLMTQKSKDFIVKKINTKHVTDTFKMDYCVKKSFLLFKLAKHNLVQMEEDLSKQYEEFLKQNNLIQHREESKIIASTSKASDSDCEIVEEPITTKTSPAKAAFNPKTVFLNKELSIKIAKKPSEEPQPKKTLNINKHSVWLNDSVVVKKIKSTQSFLAQDSRNKKPPDCNKITLEMVNNYFRMYERQKALFVCAPFTRTEWFGRERIYVCNYFVDSATDFQKKTIMQNENVTTEIVAGEQETSHLIIRPKCLTGHTYISPETLLSLCTKVLQSCFYSEKCSNDNFSNYRQNDLYPQGDIEDLKLKSFSEVQFVSDINRNILSLKNFESTNIQSLKTLCFKRVINIIRNANSCDTQTKLSADKPNINDFKEVKRLSSLCVKLVQEIQRSYISRNIKICYMPKSLKNISFFKVQTIISERGTAIDKHLAKGFIVKDVCPGSVNANLERSCYQVRTLLQLSKDAIEANQTKNDHDITPLSQSSKENINIKFEEKPKMVNTLLQLCIKKLDFINKNSHKSNTYVLSPINGKDSELEVKIDKIKTLSQLSKEDSKDFEKKIYKIKSLFVLCKENLDINLEKNCKKSEFLRTVPKSRNYIYSTLEKIYKQVKYTDEEENDLKLEKTYLTVKSLFELCKEKLHVNSAKFVDKICPATSRETKDLTLEKKSNKVKTLFQLCKESLDIHLEKSKNIITSENLKKAKLKRKGKDNKTILLSCTESTITSFPKENRIRNEELRINSVMTLKSLCYNKITELDAQWIKAIYETKLNITINNVNTVSNEEFSKAASEDDLDDVNLYNSYYPKSTYPNEDEQNSKINYGTNYDDTADSDNNWVSQIKMELGSCPDHTNYEKNSQEQHDLFIKVKAEPLDYESGNIVDLKKIKTEPTFDQECMDKSVYLPSPNVITKQENNIETDISREVKQLASNSYDEHLFEMFASSNKMMLSLDEHGGTSIFSQSSQRIRRQHEPDSDNDIDALTDSLNLLVPQTADKSKEKLLETSSDENERENMKKHDKNKSGKRKNKFKKCSKDIPNKSNTVRKDDITVLTNIMKNKIRQANNICESSDSESEDLKIKLKLNNGKRKDKISVNQLEKEIQCNDVDSTELLSESICDKDDNSDNAGCSVFADDRSVSPIVTSNEPDSFLDCKKTLSSFQGLTDKEIIQNNIDNAIKPSNTSEMPKPHAVRIHNSKDEKLYGHAYVLLDKLPESFVETYFQFQGVTDKTLGDSDFERLTNLQTIQRVHKKERNQKFESAPKVRAGPKSKTKQNSLEDSNEVNKSHEYDLKETFDELIASEDESATISKQATPDPEQRSENKFAKNLLMDDDIDSEKTDDEKKELEVKKKKIATQMGTYKTRSGRKIKCKVETEEICRKEDMVLTADKMMNKELSLLHTPVKMKEEKEEEKDFKEVEKKLCPIKSQKNTAKRLSNRNRIMTSDDSSSEEEKQWFTTKEKLLKRLSKKNGDTDVDDAKRAKIVNEFIEKRGELAETRQRPRAKRRNSKKTIMERRKQLRVLSRELFGVDSVYTKKYSQANTSKGRRNIRKVIDKKSLACSTVVANMEEFERKRRLMIRQTQLKKVLGCEENVNVVVINDELCLEYDFEEKTPVVSVHPFFTKVMKAHQYEGVKFMWDACFESVSQTVDGSLGGGCILAHCMGLGKTLQVLALLHTALTHPQLGMRRVLVCCPLSTVINWVDEIHKWIGPITNQIKVFELTKLKKVYERAYQLEDWYNGGGIFIIGYDLFRRLSTLDPVLDGIRPKVVNKIRTALLDPGPDIIVCDEGHLLKNDCSILAVAMSRVVTKRRIVLTGTPMQNNLREYYCMVNFVKPNLLGTYSEFSNRFENPIMNGQHRDSREEDIKLMKARTHILHKVLEGCLQRQEASVLYPYLPKKNEYTVFISLTKCQLELYKHYLSHYAKETKQNVLKDFHVLQKIWTHPQVLNNFLMNTRGDEKEAKIKVEKIEKLDDELEEAPEHVAAAAEWLASTLHQQDMNELESSNKFLVVFRLLHECVELGDKVLIFSTSLYTMDALEFFLRRDNKWSLGQDYYRLDGSVPAEVRQKWCREFNSVHNTHTKLFLISTRAGSLGLNMTAANRVIILDTSWNPAHDIQSIFRVYRFGQKKDCYIYRLVAMGTMEQKIYERSVTKQAVSCRVVDEQQIDRHYNMGELSELYRLDELGSGVCAGLAAGVRDPALLRVARGGELLHAVHEHDSLLRGSSETVLPEHERNAAWMQFQQEHATTNIQNFEIDLLNKKDEVSALQTKTVEKDTDNNSATMHSNTNDKTKKTQKIKNKKKESQASTSQQEVDPEREEVMIEKIMNILIEYNFHTMKTLGEISELVKNVRDVVAIAPKKGLKNVDPLIASIARVLIEADNIKIPNQDGKPVANNDRNQNESDDEIELSLLERKRRRNRRNTDEEYLPQTKQRKTYTKKTNDSINNVECNNPAINETEKNVNKEKLGDGIQLNTNLKETEKPTAKDYLTKDSDVSENFIHIDDSPPPARQEFSDNKKTINKNDEREDGEKEMSEEIKEIEEEINEIEDDNDSSNECIEVINNSDDDYSIREEQPSEPIPNEKDILATESISQQKSRIKPKEKIISKEPIIPVTRKEAKLNNDSITSEKPKRIITNKKVKKTKEPIITPEPLLTESILLSDDDELIITEPEHQERGDDKIGTENFDTKEISKQKDEKVTPLHESVLRNKNFIKLVANTYLSGNPMLDEDAATLAAQYSTLKALKGVQASGKGLTSGPIYDIAVQVLGENLIKRLHKFNFSEDNTDTIILGTEHLKNILLKGIPLNHKTDVKRIDNKDNLRPEIKKSPDNQISNQNIANILKKTIERITSETSSLNVVPVRIFKGSAEVSNQMQSVEESILPDDDEVILSSSPIPSPKGISRRNSKQLRVTAVSSKEGPEKFEQSPIPTVPGTSQTQLSDVKSKRVSTHNKSILEENKNKNASKNIKPSLNDINHKLNDKHITLQSSDETICLDSDDEDIDSNNKVQDKVPIVCTEIGTFMVSPLDKKLTSNENVSSKSAVVPDTSNRMPSPSRLTPAKLNKTTKCTNSLDQSKKVENLNSPTTVTKTKCKPGDIIRINESGKVEILKRINPVVVQCNGKTKIMTTNKDGNGDKSKMMKSLSIPAPSNRDKGTEKPKENTNLVKESKNDVKPSGSSMKDESDPHLVIRNAVFIPAVTNEKTMETAGDKLLKSCTNSLGQKTPIKKIERKTTPQNQATCSKQKSNSQLLRYELVNKNPNSDIRLDQDTKLNKIDANKEVIDLTNMNVTESMKTNDNVIQNESAAGPSQAAAANKPILPLAVDPKKMIVTIRKPKQTSFTSKTPAASSNVSKRPSPCSESISKKVKPNSKKPMTLKDFNLDDFDDIIELE